MVTSTRNQLVITFLIICGVGGALLIFLPVGETASSLPAVVFNEETPRYQQDHEEILDNFTVDIQLLTSPDSYGPRSFEYSNTTPPMPFVVGIGVNGRISGHVSGDNYYIRLEQGDNQVMTERIGNTRTPTRLTFTSDSVGTIVYVNGGEVFRSNDHISLPLNIRVGTGFRQRHWQGRFDFFDIYHAVVVPGEFPDDMGRLGPEHRIWAIENHVD